MDLVHVQWVANFFFQKIIRVISMTPFSMKPNIIIVIMLCDTIIPVAHQSSVWQQAPQQQQQHNGLPWNTPPTANNAASVGPTGMLQVMMQTDDNHSSGSDYQSAKEEMLFFFWTSGLG